RRRHTRSKRDWSSDVCSSDLDIETAMSQHPLAAMSLTSLLRRTEPCRVDDAIDAEAAAYAMLLGSDEHHHWLEQRGPAQPRSSRSEERRVGKECRSGGWRGDA